MTKRPFDNLSLYELEVEYKQASIDCYMSMLAQVRHKLGKLPKPADSPRLMDIAMLAAISNLIVSLVHPDGRDNFMKQLVAGVENLSNEKQQGMSSPSDYTEGMKRRLIQ